MNKQILKILHCQQCLLPWSSTAISNWADSSVWQYALPMHISGYFVALFVVGDMEQ